MTPLRVGVFESGSKRHWRSPRISLFNVFKCLCRSRSIKIYPRSKYVRSSSSLGTCFTSLFLYAVRTTCIENFVSITENCKFPLSVPTLGELSILLLLQQIYRYYYTLLAGRILCGTQNNSAVRRFLESLIVLNHKFNGNYWFSPSLSNRMNSSWEARLQVVLLVVSQLATQSIYELRNNDTGRKRHVQNTPFRFNIPHPLLCTSAPWFPFALLLERHIL